MEILKKSYVNPLFGVTIWNPDRTYGSIAPESPFKCYGENTKRSKPMPGARERSPATLMTSSNATSARFLALELSVLTVSVHNTSSHTFGERLHGS